MKIVILLNVSIVNTRTNVLVVLIQVTIIEVIKITSFLLELSVSMFVRIISVYVTNHSFLNE